MTFEESWAKVGGMDGWLAENEARLLWQMASLTSGPILEIGVYRGRSTTLLAGLGRLIHCVDPFAGFDSADPSGDETERIFLDRMNDRGITNFVLHRCRIEDWLYERVGFAYLDGDHTREGTIRQLEVARDCGAKLVCVHDYNIPPLGAQSEGGREIVAAVDAFPYLGVMQVTGNMAACRFTGAS